MKEEIHQYKLVPSGCQKWYNRVIANSPDETQFAFCSTLAIYVYNINQNCTVNLQHLVGGEFNEMLIGLSWCKFNKSYIATASPNGALYVYDLSNSKIRHQAQLPRNHQHNPIAIEWSPVDECIISIATSSGRILQWDISKTPPDDIVEIAIVPDLLIIRWGNFKPTMLMAGDRNGSIYNYTMDKKRVNLKCKDKMGLDIIDMQWDPCSNNYVVVVYKDSSLCLWDIQSTKVINHFEKQSPAIKCISWIPWENGGMASVNSKTGVILIWNVSRSAPVDLVRVGPIGFQCFIVLPASKKALCSFVDGSIGIFNMIDKKMDWNSNPGHCETIFDLRYKPASPDILATSSYDSSIRIWNTQNMTCQFSLTEQKGVIYGVSWPPNDKAGNYLASCSSFGTVYIWDCSLQIPILKANHHSKQVYRVSWNQLNSKYLASSSHDGTLVIFEIDGRIYRRYTLSGPVFGCEWCPFDENIIAVGCQDSVIRIYNILDSSCDPLVSLHFHKKKVFHTVWSPIVPFLLATGSDDFSICIWMIERIKQKQLKPKCHLKGHTNKVRALLWHHLFDCHLFSGSWDKSIRMWNTETEECIYVINDHLADVYGLDAHPQRPFVLASTSRDTTLRFWKVNGKHAEALLMNKLLDNSKIADRVYYSEVFTYFGGATGIENMWKLLEEPISKQSTDSNWPLLEVHHERDILQISINKAEKLINLKNEHQLGRVGKKKELQTQLEAAEIFLKCGDFESIMASCGKWELALSLAPSVSHSFWKSMATKYAEVLADEQNEKAVCYFLATNNYSSAIEFFRDRNENNEAFLVAKAVAEEKFPLLCFPIEKCTSQSTDRGSSEACAHKIQNDLADFFSNNAEPVLAACYHLSVSNSSGAIQKLIKGNLLELAFAVSKVAKKSIKDPLLHLLIKKCERWDLWELALALADMLKAPALEKALICTRCTLPSIRIEELRHDSGIRSEASYFESATDLLRNDEIKGSIRDFTLAGAYFEATEYGLNLLRDLLKKEYWDLHEIIEIGELLHNIDATALDEKTRAELLSYIAFIGLQKAIWKGYSYGVIHYLLSVIKSQISRWKIDFAVSIGYLEFQDAHYLSFTDRDAAIKAIEANFNDMLYNTGRIYLESLNNFLVDSGSRCTSSTLKKNQIITVGSNLPTGSKLHTSIFSKEIIQGQFFILEDGVSAISLEEALMWAKVNPFSPLCTGQKLNPF